MTVGRTFAFGTFLLFPERQLLVQGESAIRIGGRALDLLTALVERPGELLSKTDLMARVWPTTTVDESNLKVNMAALRRVLDDDAGAARFIATVTGRGYRFVAPVEIGGSPTAGRQDRRAPSRPAGPDRWAGLDHMRGISSPLAVSARSSGPFMLDDQISWSSARLIDLPPNAEYSVDGPSQVTSLLDTVGYGIVVDGEMTLHLGDTIVLLKPGSMVARRSSQQQAASLSAKPCRLLSLQMNAEQDHVPVFSRPDFTGIYQS